MLHFQRETQRVDQHCADVSISVVQKHTPWNLNACASSPWCEAFAPHITSARLPIPSCVPLHHRRSEEGNACSGIQYWISYYLSFQKAKQNFDQHCADVSSSVVQRHTPWNLNACACSLWCEAFAPHITSARLPTPSCVPLHHRRSTKGNACYDI